MGDQTFCYPCAHNEILVMGVSKALAVMNGLDPMEGIWNWYMVKEMKFHLNYDIEQSHDEAVKSESVVAVKETGPSPAELKERARKKVR